MSGYSRARAPEQQQQSGSSVGLADPHPGHTPFVHGSTLSDEELDRDRPVGGPVPADIRAALFEQLQGSAIIVESLRQIREARGDLDFDLLWNGRGTNHLSGAIRLDRRLGETEWVSSMMHELEHLRTFVRGEAANIDDQERTAYVEAKVGEEIRAHSQTYVALLQQGVPSSRSKGYNEFVAHLEATRPDLLGCEGDPAAEAVQWQEVRDIASVWLEDKYRHDDSWKTSDTNKTYYDHYGDAWDARHGVTP